MPSKIKKNFKVTKSGSTITVDVHRTAKGQRLRAGKFNLKSRTWDYINHKLLPSHVARGVEQAYT